MNEKRYEIVSADLKEQGIPEIGLADSDNAHDALKMAQALWRKSKGKLSILKRNPEGKLVPFANMDSSGSVTLTAEAAEWLWA